MPSKCPGSRSACSGITIEDGTSDVAVDLIVILRGIHLALVRCVDILGVINRDRLVVVVVARHPRDCPGARPTDLELTVVGDARGDIRALARCRQGMLSEDGRASRIPGHTAEDAGGWACL